MGQDTIRDEFIAASLKQDVGTDLFPIWEPIRDEFIAASLKPESGVGFLERLHAYPR